jgi:hypothetical protein
VLARRSRRSQLEQASARAEFVDRRPHDPLELEVERAITQVHERFVQSERVVSLQVLEIVLHRAEAARLVGGRRPVRCDDLVRLPRECDCACPHDLNAKSVSSRASAPVRVSLDVGSLARPSFALIFAIRPCGQTRRACQDEHLQQFHVPIVKKAARLTRLPRQGIVGY